MLWVSLLTLAMACAVEEDLEYLEWTAPWKICKHPDEEVSQFVVRENDVNKTVYATKGKFSFSKRRWRLDGPNMEKATPVSKDEPFAKHYACYKKHGSTSMVRKKWKNNV
ncbi:unnamed protein product [Cylicocyclus nassatus]|uniref:Uncharacterized protein n=1 Tax=Cylicocyclus nassatus TaxID=53992 RepID=A0AA36GRY7_CYLNA|nr:unnamed protein product [Cylicocyclus nassatus]